MKIFGTLFKNYNPINVPKLAERKDLNADLDFQAKVQRGHAKQIPSTEPAWKPMVRGVAINLQDLRDFLENDLNDLLLNTIVKADNKKGVKDVVDYITTQKEHSIPAFFDEYKQSTKRDMTQILKNTLGDFLTENPDIDLSKVVREMPIISSLLHLSREVGPELS